MARYWIVLDKVIHNSFAHNYENITRLLLWQEDPQLLKRKLITSPFQLYTDKKLLKTMSVN